MRGREASGPEGPGRRAAAQSDRRGTVWKAFVELDCILVAKTIYSDGKGGILGMLVSSRLAFLCSLRVCRCLELVSAGKGRRGVCFLQGNPPALKGNREPGQVDGGFHFRVANGRGFLVQFVPNWYP